MPGWPNRVFELNAPGSDGSRGARRSSASASCGGDPSVRPGDPAGPEVSGSSSEESDRATPRLTACLIVAPPPILIAVALPLVVLSIDFSGVAVALPADRPGPRRQLCRRPAG